MKRLLAKSASAGSGKTTALVFRYISLLLGGAKTDEIIALTFTVKAANNMKERIFAALDGIENYPFLDELCDECGIDRQEAIQRAKKISANLSGSAMRISTIDSFFSSILGKFCFYAGVPYGYETLEETDISRLRQEFISSLSRVQKDAVTLFLAEHDKGLEYFLELFDFLESKNADAKELFCAIEPNQIEFEAEFASHCANIAKYAQNDRQKKLFVYDGIESLAGKTWLANKSLQDHSYLTKLEFGHDGLESFEQLKTLMKLYFTHKQAKLARTIDGLFELYEGIKNRSFIKKGKLSFSDISLIVFRLLRGEESIDTDFLYFRLDGKISHILIDEFQDTSILQYEILFPLIHEVASGLGQSEFGSFFFVGDTKQSIYRFRGGNSELFGEVANALVPYGLEVEQLDTNYRSDKAIVEFANGLFEGVMQGYTPQKYSKNAKEGFVEVVQISSALAVEDEDEISHHPLCVEVVRIIEELTSKGVSQSDIAILTATNADSVAVVDAIRELAGLQALQDVSLKVVESKSAMAVISYIKYLFFGETIYKEHFLACLDASLFGGVPLMTTQCSPCELVANVMSEFGIFSDETAKLVDMAAKYESVYDFVHEIDDDKTKLPEGKSDGIKVLTVHKSKGLEFGYTICMDRTASRGANDDGLLFEYDGMSLRRAFFRFKNREFFDDEYAAAKKEEKAAQMVDRLNMLYVAFTRAEHALFIVKKPPKLLKGGEMKYDGVFTLDALTPTRHGELYIAQAKGEEHEEGGIMAFALQDHGRQEVQKQKDRLEASQELVYQGLALHLLMENIDFSNGKQGVLSALAVAQNRYGAAVQDMSSVERMAKDAICNEDFLALVAKAQIFKECSFCFGGRVGRIDLLAMTQDATTIIDYKSAGDIKKEHQTQLARYKQAVKSIMGKEPKAFVYALGDKPILVEV